MIVKSVSEKRLIIEVSINGKKGYMLVDTGASLSLLDINCLKSFNIEQGAKMAGEITGVGGQGKSAYYLKKADIHLQGIKIHQVVGTDISEVASSIRKTTGYSISGIIGLPQIKSAEMKIDADNGIIKIGY